ncbi:DUF968 domain-containing protein [Cronobacter sakazakii]|uniref:DUF968 domain-containing protein n=1 Tax=Cronobacter sakazakii TaxID=28141 RepID=UPI00159ECBCA|nr:DUF968 domain-containing protein [Cronobacter sakazakii]
MRALLTPEIARGMGIVLLRPGPELMPIFANGRVLVEVQPESMVRFPSGAVPPAHQPLADDEGLQVFFTDERVIRAAGGINGLEHWLMKQQGGCQWPHSEYHHHELTTMRHEPGALRLCWHCDNQLAGHFTERLSAIARSNVIAWIISVARGALAFDDTHELTLPELCWWAVRMDITDALPDSVARRALRLPPLPVQGVSRESDMVPGPSAAEIVQTKAQRAGAVKTLVNCDELQEQQPRVVALTINPESPESYMLRPKRRRWENEKYTRWVKQQPCACCNQRADDPHHLIGHGQGGMGTKAHDLFVLPLCRRHHDELHRDTVAFEEKYGSQLELIFRFLDRALALGVLA